MKNNKGFAISTIIYSMVILFLMLMLLILLMLSTRKVILDKQKTGIINSINGTEEDAKLYKETLLNGAYPELYKGLVPVTIDNDGTVKKADTTKMWYSYENKIWANAVILTGADIYNAGDTIKEEEIKQYYVWIPRYRYKLWNVNSELSEGAEQPINIVFENKKEVRSTGSNNGEWLTHPAFISFNSNGIWVGKFETSYNEDSYTNSSTFLTKNANASTAIQGSNIIIKPNVRSLSNKNVSQFYELGINTNKNLNSHMMKNTEWGAVAYLTYSVYGNCTSSSCEEVYPNNVNTGYLTETAKFTGQWEYGATITGCSASSTSASVSSNQSSCAAGYAWNGKNNKSSTNGNISGIYDMSGGDYEYMMFAIMDSNGNPISGQNSTRNSGFNGTFGCPTCNSDTSGLTSLTNGVAFPTDKRYYDLYTPNSTELNDGTWYVYTNSYLGDAMKEMSISKSNSSSGSKTLWFNDYAYYPTTMNPLIYRGGAYNSRDTSGITSFGWATGILSAGVSFRIVLAP